MTYLIRNAAYLDVTKKASVLQDVLVQDGMVAAMGPGLGVPEGAQIIEGEGMFLTTGWIDSHVHIYDGPGSLGVSGDDMLRNGVTYVQDAGSAGSANFRDFVERNIQKQTQRIRSYVYLSPWGISGTQPELQDLSVVDFGAITEVVQAYPELARGIKLRIDPRVCHDILGALRMAREIADRLNLPIVVHASRGTEPMEKILDLMGPGDIYAHVFANKLPGLLDENGRVKQCAWDVRNRGVKFDLAHGNGNFSYEVCKKAVEQGFLPDAVSTDLHGRSLPRVKTLAMTMSKALACGMDLWTVLEKVTVDSGRMLQLTDKQMTVETGRPADLVLFRVEDRPEELADSDGVTMTCPKQIRPVVTMLKDGCYMADEAVEL